ncbi:MAG: GNAT family N-acetyltransferase [Lachnospiraceae bacterium]|jgi:GNAT superfamily N-acetyltransferase|nr:GNAT family N-acetyltransferase [Lachnospiraceae bacterium]
MELRFIKDYMKDSALRHTLNKLTEETFGFNFETWVTNGYYEGDYIPYSYEENGRLIANVSVNRMEFIQNGQEKHYIQLGTVMTGKEFRNRGYASELIEKVLADYVGKCDGIYLFGNLNALGFYDKMGFSRGMQYQYILKNDARIALQKKARELDKTDCFLPVDPAEQLPKNRYMDAVRHSAANAALEQKNKYGLQMFHTAGMEQVYYSRKLDCYVVMEEQNRTLYLQSVTCTKRIRLEQVLAHIRGEYDRMILGFAPCIEDADLLDAQLYDGKDDYRLFYYGEELERIETEKLFFPVFSHA